MARICCEVARYTSKRGRTKISSGHFRCAEGILEANPHHEEALRCRQRCTEVLSQMYLARLGSLAQVVRVALSGDQIRWLSLDHRAGFLLSLPESERTATLAAIIRRCLPA